jgi:uncharacterized membrane protein
MSTTSFVDLPWDLIYKIAITLASVVVVFYVAGRLLLNLAIKTVYLAGVVTTGIGAYQVFKWYQDNSFLLAQQYIQAQVKPTLDHQTALDQLYRLWTGPGK